MKVPQGFGAPDISDSFDAELARADALAEKEYIRSIRGPHKPRRRKRLPLTPDQKASNAAKIIGISGAEYSEHLAAGDKWCSGCKAWHVREAFGMDLSRGDRTSPSCREFLQYKHRKEKYTRVFADAERTYRLLLEHMAPSHRAELARLLLRDAD
jgi:hypothetical protein